MMALADDADPPGIRANAALGLSPHSMMELVAPEFSAFVLREEAPNNDAPVAVVRQERGWAEGSGASPPDPIRHPLEWSISHTGRDS
jgi:hypothetical protein